MMKVDSSIYTRYSIDYASAPKNGKVDTQKEQQAQVEKSQSVDSYKSIASKVAKSVEAAQKSTELPAHLQDVVTPEESQMLQELFNGFSSQWGVDAYKLNNVQMTLGAKGNQLDLIS